jgi:hypothetical protein
MAEATTGESTTASDNLHHGHSTQHATSWKTVQSKATTSKTNAQKKAKAATKSLFDSESDSDSDDEATLPVKIPEKNSNFLLSDTSVTSRFSVTMEIESSLDPEKFLGSTVAKLNAILKRFTTEGQLSGYSGRAFIIPWEDNKMYSNCAWGMIKKRWEHTKLLSFIREMVYGYGAPKGRKQDKDISRKYCRINLTWASPHSMSEDKLSSLMDYLNGKKHYEPESFSLLPAPTAAINPTIAVQFRNSVLKNNSNWNDKGHEDCLEELNDMIKTFLPSHVKNAGLKKSPLQLAKTLCAVIPQCSHLNVKRLMNH